MYLQCESVLDMEKVLVARIVHISNLSPSQILRIHQSIDVKIDNPEQENIDFILPGQQYGIHF